MFNLLNRLNKALPDVWEDYIDIISVNRDQVGDNKGGGGPDDQKHGQKAQSLHLGQMCKDMCSAYFTSRKVETCILPTVTW